MVSDNLNSGHFGYTQIFYFYHASFYNANRYPFCRQWVGPYGLPFHQMLEKNRKRFFSIYLLLNAGKQSQFGKTVNNFPLSLI